MTPPAPNWGRIRQGLGRLAQSKFAPILALFLILLFAVSLFSSRPIQAPMELKQGNVKHKPVPANAISLDSLPLKPAAASHSHDLISQLNAVQCIPQICKGATGFAASKNFTFLTSFPGSGNTWARAIIEQGTKIYTGSVFFDTTLYKDGFKGELLAPFKVSSSRVSVIKTHYPFLLTGGFSPQVSGAVLIMRSPFDALLAEFTRRYGKGENAHRSQLSDDTLQRFFPTAFTQGSIKWLEYVKFWFGEEGLRKNKALVVDRRNGVTSLEFERMYTTTTTKRTVHVLVLFYEDFVRNFAGTTERLFDFLKQRMGEEMPTTALEAVICTITKGRKSQRKQKRKHDENEYNVYADEKNLLAQRHAVQRACQLWEPFWFEDIWGPCLEPTPQVNRLPIAQDFLQVFSSVNAYCESEGEAESRNKVEEEVEEDERGSDYAESSW